MIIEVEDEFIQANLKLIKSLKEERESIKKELHKACEDGLFYHLQHKIDNSVNMKKDDISYILHNLFLDQFHVDNKIKKYIKLHEYSFGDRKLGEFCIVMETECYVMYWYFEGDKI